MTMNAAGEVVPVRSSSNVSVTCAPFAPAELSIGAVVSSGGGTSHVAARRSRFSFACCLRTNALRSFGFLCFLK